VGLRKHNQQQPIQQIDRPFIKRVTDPKSADDRREAFECQHTDFHIRVRNATANRELFEEELAELLTLLFQERTEEQLKIDEEALKKRVADSELTQKKINEATVLMGAPLPVYARTVPVPQQFASVPAHLLSELSRLLYIFQQKANVVNQNIIYRQNQIQQINQQWQTRRQLINQNLVNAVGNGQIPVFGLNNQQIDAATAKSAMDAYYSSLRPTPLSTKLRYTRMDTRIREQQERGENILQSEQSMVRFENAIEELNLLITLSRAFGCTTNEILAFRRNNPGLFQAYARAYADEVQAGTQNIHDMIRHSGQLANLQITAIGIKIRSDEIIMVIDKAQLPASTNVEEFVDNFKADINNLDNNKYIRFDLPSEEPEQQAESRVSMSRRG